MNDKGSRAGALADIAVLDLSRVLAGPWCTQILADLGAEVVKIERPGLGDDTRHWGPPWLEDAHGGGGRDATYFAAANRNKQSVTLDISRPEGQEIARRLAAQSDVLVENYKVGDLARYGLDYVALSELNPKLIYCSITGYGQDGPDASRPGYDFVLQGEGGLMSVTGPAAGQPGGGPYKAGPPVADLMTGMYAATAILAALHARLVTGRGQHIDCALLDSAVALNATLMAGYFVTGRPPAGGGNSHPTIVPYQTFAANDGTIVVAAGNDGQWRRLCGVLGQSGLADDRRFATNRDRVANREALIAILEPLFRQRPASHWIGELRRADIPGGAINDYRQVFDDPQVRHRRLRVDMERPTGSRVSAVGSPIRLSETPVTYRTAPPELGQATEAVLEARLGISPAEIAALKKKGVL